MSNRKYDKAFYNGSRNPIDAAFAIEECIVFQQHSHGNDVGANRPAANTQYHEGQQMMLVEALLDKNKLAAVYHCSKNHCTEAFPLGTMLLIQQELFAFNRNSGKGWKTCFAGAARLVDVIKKEMKGNRSTLAFVFARPFNMSHALDHAAHFSQDQKVLIDSATLNRIRQVKADAIRVDAEVNNLYLELKRSLDANGDLAFKIIGSNLAAFRGSIMSDTLIARLAVIKQKHAKER